MHSLCKILIEANRLSPHGMHADNCGLKLVIHTWNQNNIYSTIFFAYMLFSINWFYTQETFSPVLGLQGLRFFLSFAMWILCTSRILLQRSTAYLTDVHHILTVSGLFSKISLASSLLHNSSIHSLSKFPFLLSSIKEFARRFLTRNSEAYWWDKTW